MTASIVWLASYPKSGNTWVRIWLENYLCNSDEAASINHMRIASGASQRSMLDRALGLSTSDLTFDELDWFRSLAYTQLARWSDEPLYLKTHDAYRYLDDGRAVLSADVPCSAVIVVRNPLDIAVSYAAYNGLDVNTQITLMANEAYALADFTGGELSQIRQKIGSWSGHTASWLDAPDLRRLLVRYEDLKSDSVGEYTRIAEFLQLPMDAERIERAVKFSSFGELQKQEQKRGFIENVEAGTSTAFFRQGRAGGWRGTLTNQQVNHIITDHGVMMCRLGYMTDAGMIID